MATPQDDTLPDQDIYPRDERPSRPGATEVIAIVLSLLWLVAMGGYFLWLDREGAARPDSLGFVMTLLAIFLPVALIWVAATAARSTRVIREESRRLHTAIDVLRETYVQTRPTGNGATRPSVERKLDEIAAAQRKAETAIATFTSIRTEPDSAGPISALPQGSAPVEEQGILALGTPAEALAAPVNIPDFIRALNFPENADDSEGFRALRRALQDRQTQQLVQASQTVLTLLAQDGIYMDDLRPDRARPEVWRRFAAGQRGRNVAALGGVRDRSCLALTAGRMRQDQEFRDAAHHFLRRFDTTFAAFESHAGDADIAALADTRTARAFMLLGRVAGTFD